MKRCFRLSMLVSLMRRSKLPLFQMNALTALGPCRLSPLFYQWFWNVVGSDVSRAVFSFIESRKMLKKINYTYVSLIPKQVNPSKMSHLHPISLCNVVYKIAFKVLTNRLKLILPKIISHHQSAFVPGCLISNNIILATEIAHFIFKCKRGKKGFMAMKHGINKAYD